MPNLKDIKNRIHSVKSTQKITKAMKMISTARLSKARVNLANHLEYSNAMQGFISSLLPLIDIQNEEISSPIVRNFYQDFKKKALVVVISTDKGLCGALNTFVFKELMRNMQEGDVIVPLGKKAFEFTKSRFPIGISRPFLTSKAEQHNDMINYILDVVKKNNIGSIKIIFPQFVSVMVQISKTEPFPSLAKSYDKSFIVEGCPVETLEKATLEAIKSVIMMGISQLLCSEHAARMIAMENATNNAKARIKALTLIYNKTRQANITKEILEIVSGSQAI